MTRQMRDVCRLIKGTADAKIIILYGIKNSPSGKEIKEANFCVVVDGDPKQAEKLLYLTLELSFPYNLLVYDLETWSKLIADPTSYASSILNKGVILFGKKENKPS